MAKTPKTPKASKSTTARDPAVVSRFVERFAQVFVEAGMPRIASRIFVALVATDSGRLTAAELAEQLRASPAAISGGVRYLIQVDLVSRERERPDQAPPSPARPPGSVTISGRVLDPQGRPVPHARVYFLPGNVGSESMTFPRPSRTAPGDAAGDFRLTVPRAEAVGQAVVLATADGFGVAWDTARPEVAFIQ